MTALEEVYGPRPTEPRIVSPQEAQERLRAGVYLDSLSRNLGHTVATELERIAAAERAAVVKALIAEIAFLVNEVGCTHWSCGGPDVPREDMVTCRVCWRVQDLRAAIENGAPL